MSKKDVLKGRSIVRKEVREEPSVNSEEERQTVINLNDVAEYYHKKFFENEKALKYLESLGIRNKELYSRFKVGFADGTLLNVIGESQKEELKKNGILLKKEIASSPDESGLLAMTGENEYIEKYLNCLVFPIYDDTSTGLSASQEEVKGFWGISIDSSQDFDKLSLTAQSGSVGQNFLFNEKALKVYNDRIIFAESIIEALSLMEMGFENVIGYEGRFELEHVEKFKAHRVKEVVLALKDEDGSITVAEVIKEILNCEGINARVLYSPSGSLSWNDVLKKSPLSPLLKGTRGDSLKKEVLDLIELSRVSKVDDLSDDFKVKKEGLNYIFQINDVSYRLAGVKDLFVNNLKVNIRADFGTEWFPDSVDLYSSRSREAFSGKLGLRFNIESKRVEKDLLTILDYLEKEQMKKLSYNGKNEKVELTEEERELGLKFLKSSDIFQEIIDDMTTLGCVGEDNNKLLTWLAGNTRLLPKQLSTFIQSPPSVGKSYLLETYLRIMPPEFVEWITSSSDQGFVYMPDENFIGKIFMMGEALHNEIIEGYIRQMQSENRLSRNVVTKDMKTGEMQTVKKMHEVQLVFMMTSTAMNVNRENLSRCMVMKMDNSKEQTEKILAMQRYKSSFDGYLEEKHLIPCIIKKHLAAQRLLKKIKIFNPFEKYIKFPSISPIARRGQPQFLLLINSSCVSRQMQKTPVEKLDHYTGKKEMIYECDLRDYEIARKLFIESGLFQNDNDLSNSVIALYEAVRKMVREKAKKENLKPEDVSFIRQAIVEKKLVELEADTIKKYIRILVDHEYLQVVSGKKHGTRFCYRLREDKAINEIDISSVIPAVEEIKKLMEMDKGAAN